MNEYSNMTNDELLEDYTQLNELIYVIKCYGKNDLLRFNNVCHEMTRREE